MLGFGQDIGIDLGTATVISYLKTYGIGENYVQKKKRLYSNYYSE